MTTLVSVADMVDAIMAFINTDTYKTVLETIQDDKEAGFKTGLALVPAIVISNCKTYILQESNECPEEPKDESVQSI